MYRYYSLLRTLKKKKKFRSQKKYITTLTHLLHKSHYASRCDWRTFWTFTRVGGGVFIVTTLTSASLAQSIATQAPDQWLWAGTTRCNSRIFWLGQGCCVDISGFGLCCCVVKQTGMASLGSMQIHWREFSSWGPLCNMYFRNSSKAVLLFSMEDSLWFCVNSLIPLWRAQSQPSI